MPCNCMKAEAQKTAKPKKTPRSPCLLCAEKHLSGAREHAAEHGYKEENRAFVVGGIWAAELHLAPSGNPEVQKLLSDLRDFRHRIQAREEDETTFDFAPFLKTLDRLIWAEKEQTP